MGCAWETPRSPGTPLRSTCCPSELASCSSMESPQGWERVLSHFSEKTVRSPACHGVSSTTAAGYGLSRDFRPSAERNKLQVVPDVRPLTLPQSFQLSLTTGQYFGRSELLKRWSSPAFTPKRIGFFVFWVFFWQDDSCAHISHGQRSLADFNS